MHKLSNSLPGSSVFSLIVHVYHLPCKLIYVYVLGLLLFANYGWYILLGVIVLFIVWVNIKPIVQRWLKKREERVEEQNFDPVKAERYQDGMLKAREKMQKDLEEKALERQAVVEEVS